MKILVTAIGSFSADCVINTLHGSGHYVVGCDIYPREWHAVAKDCDSFYQVPFATSEEYIPFLIDVCQKESINYLFPLTDLEIDIINNHRSEFAQIGVVLCMQSESCLEIARNKLLLSSTFEKDSKVSVPFYVSSAILDEHFPLPAIAKPINGRSSEGLMRIYQKEELVPLICKDGYIVQKMIDGPIFTVDYVRDSYGNDFSIPREELLRTKNGAGTTIRITPSQELSDTVSYIGDKLGVVGCINMEFILHDNKFYLIDINPRFSAGVAFSKFVGYDMATSHLNCFSGKAILPKISFTEQIVCKRYKEELV